MTINDIPNELFNQIRDDAQKEFLMQIDYAALILCHKNPDTYTYDKALLEILHNKLKEQVEVPNETTIKAIEEADEMIKNGCGGYDNLDDLWRGNERNRI